MTRLSARLRLPAVLAAMAIVVACSDRNAPTSPTEEQRPHRVVVIGDSLAVAPSSRQSFPAQLQTMLQQDFPGSAVVNAGVNGDTTAGGARRVQALLDDSVTVLVVALGANDGLSGVGVSAVEQNLSMIIAAARARGILVLLCGMDTLPTHGFEYMLAFHEIYPRLARIHNVPLVPFLLSGVALVPEMNGPDGIHPNAAGARRIAESVWTYLRPLLQRAAAAASGTIGHFAHACAVPVVHLKALWHFARRCSWEFSGMPYELIRRKTCRIVGPSRLRTASGRARALAMRPLSRAVQLVF